MRSDISATNADGFKWSSMNRTSIVIQDAKDGPVAVYNNNTIYRIHSTIMPDGTKRDWTAKHGNYSMRFNYPAEQTMAEQRFNLGTPYRDIWVSYWLRVPTNFQHRDASPTNLKISAFWMDGYSAKGNGPAIIFQAWSNQNGGASFNVQWSESGTTIVGGNGRTTSLMSFISYPNDQGRWAHIVYHFKASTNDSSNDGAIQAWRKWSGEASYQTLVNVTKANMPSPAGGSNGWLNRYLMGWANPKYAVVTEWLLDDFTVSDQSLLNTKSPKPPVLDSVQN